MSLTSVSRSDADSSWCYIRPVTLTFKLFNNSAYLCPREHLRYASFDFSTFFCFRAMSPMGQMNKQMYGLTDGWRGKTCNVAT